MDLEEVPGCAVSLRRFEKGNGIFSGLLHLRAVLSEMGLVGMANPAAGRGGFAAVLSRFAKPQERIRFFEPALRFLRASAVAFELPCLVQGIHFRHTLLGLWRLLPQRGR